MLLEKQIEHIKDERVRRAVRVEARIISILRDYLMEHGFVELLPVIISKVTDPLTTIKTSAEIEISGHGLKLTKSMIFHKQLALFAFDRIFVFSPNIRVEDPERESTGRHLLEFVQLDVEIKNGKREDVMNLIEEMLYYLLEKLKDTAWEDLEFFGRLDLDLKPPFPRVNYSEAVSMYGEDYEEKLSSISTKPVWVIDFPESFREFYYKSDSKSRHMYDFDLLYPEGFGEAISGGEREDDPASVLRKLSERSEIELCSFYLTLIESGLSPSCGFGIGIERLTRFICGLKHVKYARLFPKLPGLKDFLI